MRYIIAILVIASAVAESYIISWFVPWHMALPLVLGLLVAIVTIKLEYWWVAILGGGILDLTSASVFGIHTVACLMAAYLVVWLKQKYPNKIFWLAPGIALAEAILCIVVQGNVRAIVLHNTAWLIVVIFQGLTAALITSLSLLCLKWVDNQNPDYEHRTILR
jgi:hypothetical protein